MPKRVRSLAEWSQFWPWWLRRFVREKRGAKRPGVFQTLVRKRFRTPQGRLVVCSFVAAVIIPRTSWMWTRRPWKRRIGKRGLGLSCWEKGRVPCYVLWELLTDRSIDPVPEWRSIPLRRIRLERLGSSTALRQKGGRFWVLKA